MGIQQRGFALEGFNLSLHWASLAFGRAGRVLVDAIRAGITDEEDVADRLVLGIHKIGLNTGENAVLLGAGYVLRCAQKGTRRGARDDSRRKK